MDMFKMIKEAAAMRSKLAQMDKALRENVITVEARGITIRINAKSEILDIKLPQEFMGLSVEKAQKDILDAVQQAVKQSHDVMMEEAKKMTGGMNIPGLM